MKQIKTREEYQVAIAEIESYLAKGFDNLTSEEDGQLERLSKMISHYESIYFSMPVKPRQAFIIS